MNCSEKKFSGFSQETSQYLWDLAFHNEKPWFDAHKETFLRVLKEPFDLLARDTLQEMQVLYPEIEWRLHVSRIYRDARRLFGRGPYKDHLWFTLRPALQEAEGLDFWFELGAASYRYGLGAWGTPSQMEQWRRYIDAEPAAVERLAEELWRDGCFTLGGEEYKRPKGDKGPLLNPWYNRRWLELSAAFDFGGAALTPKLPQIVADAYHSLMPYRELFLHIYTETDNVKEERF